MKKIFLCLFIVAVFSTLMILPAFCDEGDSYFYVDSGSGHDRNGGKSPDDALSTFNRAILNAKKEGVKSAVIVIMSPYKVSGHLKETEHAGFTITVTSNDGKTDYRATKGAVMRMGSRNRYYLGGETTFENITFEFEGTLLFGAQYNPITVGDGVVMNCTDKQGLDAVGVEEDGAYIAGGYIYPSGSYDLDLDSHITVKSGEFRRILGGTFRWGDGKSGGSGFTGTHYVNIEGGYIKGVYGGSWETHFSENLVINVNGGRIDALYTGGDGIRRLRGDATLNLRGGEIASVNVNNVLGDVTVNLDGTKVSSMYAYFYDVKILKEHDTWGKRTVNYNGTKYTAEQAQSFSKGFDLVTDTTVKEVLNDKLARFDKLVGNVGENVRFVIDGGSGSGKRVSDPSGSIVEAFKALGSSGGTVVVVGKYTIDTPITLEQWNGKITVTSVYGGVDFAKENSACLAFRKNLTLGGELELCNVKIAAENIEVAIYANGHPITLGEGITSELFELSMTYVSVFGGYASAKNGTASSITVHSGNWQKISGGDGVGGSRNISANIVINGGEMHAPLLMGSVGSHTGKSSVTVNGGKLYQGIRVADLGLGETVNVDATVTVNGGEVYADISIDEKPVGKYNGSFTVNLIGGEYGHLVSVCGSEGYSGNIKATLNIDKKIDIAANEEGKVTFKNPILQDGADPWLFMHEGMYYITSTIGSRGIGIARAANLSDLFNAEFRIIYTPPKDDPWMKSNWSPEIHYYTDEQIGAGNGGWYCYFCCDGEGEGEHFRAMVIKCLDGDNLYGNWGHPLTGEVGRPLLVDAVDIPEVEGTFHGGQTDVIIDGELYAFFTTLLGSHTKGDGQVQVELIAKMPNPWTLQGPAEIISIPTYDWEKYGSIWDIRSEVNEGGTAVYGDDGSVFMVFSGSYYDGPEYKLGQLKYLGGDPLDINNWEKKPTPILDKSEEITGCGHASYMTDVHGNKWICYHAYITGDTTMRGYGAGRRAFVEMYTADKNGVVIGNGSGHPAPLDTEYTVEINPMPLEKKIKGFETVNRTEAQSVKIDMTLNSLTAYVNGVAKTLDAAPVISNSRTMLPVRFVAENLGATVGWDAVTKTVSIKGEGTTVEIVIGETTARVNGRAVTLDAPAYIDANNNRTYLPVRVVAENLGATVSWNDATKTATLTK